MIQNAFEENNKDKAIVYTWAKRKKVCNGECCWQNEEMCEQEKSTKPHKQSTQFIVSRNKASWLLTFNEFRNCYGAEYMKRYVKQDLKNGKD